MQLVVDHLEICIIVKFYEGTGVLVKFDFALTYFINREQFLNFMYDHQK